MVNAIRSAWFEGRAQALSRTLGVAALALAWSGSAQAQYPAGAEVLHGHWVTSADTAPPPSDALRAGTEGGATPLYLCRSFYNNAYLAGKVVGGECYVPYNGTEVQLHQYEILGGQPIDDLWGPPNRPDATPLVVDPYHLEVHACRGNLNAGGADIGLEAGTERGGQCLVSWRGGAYQVLNYQILYEIAPLGSPYPRPDPYASAQPQPNPYAQNAYPPYSNPTPYSPSPSPYVPPTPYGQNPPYSPPNYSPPNYYGASGASTLSSTGRTSEFMAGYSTFGAACIGRQDEHLEVRMAGRSDDERQLVLHGDGKLHMFIPQGTVVRAACGAWPDSSVVYQYHPID